MNWQKVKHFFFLFPPETRKFFLISFIFAILLFFIEIVFFYLLSNLLQNTFTSQHNITVSFFDLKNWSFNMILAAFVCSVILLQVGNILFLHLNGKICGKIIFIMTKKYLFCKKVNYSYYNFKSKSSQFQKTLTQDIDIVLSSILNPLLRLLPNLMKSFIALIIILKTSDYKVLITSVCLIFTCIVINSFAKKSLNNQKKYITLFSKDRQKIIHDFLAGFYELKLLGYDKNLKNEICKIQESIAAKFGHINLLISSPKFLLELILYCILAFFLFSIYAAGHDKNKNLANIGIWLVALQRLLSGIEGTNQCLRNIMTFAGFLKPFKKLR